MTDVAVPGRVYVEANWGRWVARCPRPFCDSALEVWPSQSRFGCWTCDAQAEMVWPPDPAAIEALLMMRPAAKTRNWLPGETLAQLMFENAAHGLLPAGWRELGTVPLMLTAEERVVGGLLADTLPALTRLPIGA